MVPLYDRLRTVKELVTVGFADNTNLLAYGTETAQYMATLEEGWAIYETWAIERAIAFEPAKSSLLHFCRARAGRSETVRLSGDVVTLQESARFLGVILDRKLRFAAYKKHVINRLYT